MLIIQRQNKILSGSKQTAPLLEMSLLIRVSYLLLGAFLLHLLGCQHDLHQVNPPSEKGLLGSSVPLDEAVARADLIVVGRFLYIENSGFTRPGWSYWHGRVRVAASWKGEADKGEVDVKFTLVHYRETKPNSSENSAYILFMTAEQNADALNVIKIIRFTPENANQLSRLLHGISDPGFQIRGHSLTLKNA